jgi:HAE1 family hydrophobic/amphiphilic exporter-1
MNISAIFILRPVMTTLVMAGVMLFGLIAFFTLPIDDLPAVDFPYIVVSAGLPGASPETMASAVATPLEKQFSNIAGVESMTSSNRMGSSTIVLQFTLDRKLDGAAEDIQAAINAARTLLPAAMPTPPTLQKVNPADSPILTIALSSATLPLYVVDEYAENMLSPRISMISDVAQVQVWGSQIYAPHVQVDPRKLAVLGIGIDEVCSTIQNSNVNLPTGALYGPSTSYNVRVNGQCSNAADLRPLIVKYKNGAPVRLSDVGDVIDSVKTDKRATWYKSNLGTERAIVLGVYKQPNTNTIQIVDNVKQMLQSFKAAMPGSVRLNVLYDRSRSIRNSVAEVERTLGITIVIVVLVIYFFLGNPSTTLIASLSLPISLLGTFAAMKLLGFTLNNITLMAITLCVGFVVDDAIVVLENIICHVEQGMPAFQAAIRGAREIGFTILAMTSSLAAVFIPVLLMGGIIGRIFYQFAVTIIAAVVISGIVSLSLTPMLCSRFLRHNAGPPRGITFVTEKIIGVWIGFYEFTLKIALKNRDVVVVVFLLTLGASWMMLQWVPKGFIPSEDTGQINGTVQAIEGISFEDMKKHEAKVAKIVSKCPDLYCYMSSIGNGVGGLSGNQGRLNLFLKPQSERKSTADQIIADLRKKCAKLVGVKFFMQNPPSIRIGGQMTKALYQVTIYGSDLTELYAAADKLTAAIKDISSITDLNSDLQIKDLKLRVKIDRDKCSNLGISLEQVQDALNSAYASRQVSTIFTETNQYWVILEVEPQYYENPQHARLAADSLKHRHAGSTKYSRPNSKRCWSHSSKPSWTIALCHSFIQSETELSVERRG